MINSVLKDKNIIASSLLLGGGIAGHVMLEVARDSLFLEAFSSSMLPWAYIAVALFSALLVVFIARQKQSLNTRRLISGGYFATGVTVLSFIVLLRFDIPRHWVAFGLYVWVGVYITLLVSSVWLLISSLFTIHQAKRAYGIISAGAAAGAIVGGAIASAITFYDGSIEIVLIAAAVMFFISGLTPLLFTLQPVVSDKVSTTLSGDLSFLAELKKSDYVQSIAALVLFSTVAVTGVDWLFKVVVEAEVASDQLSAFFSRFHLLTNIASVAIQVFFLQWFFRLFGAIKTLYVFPFVLLLGSLLVFSPFAFVAILGLKFADGALKNSLHKPATELLYIPLHEHVRKKLKLALDLISLRGGQALGSGLLLILSLWLPTKAVACVVILFGLAVSIYILVRLKPKYITLFRDYLREGRIGINLERPKLDLMSAEVLLESLNSNNDDVVLSALAFLKNENKSTLISPLILFHPSEKVVLTALDIFTQSPRPSLKNTALRLLGEKSESVRVAALRLLIQLGPPKQFLHAISRGEDMPLKTTAMVTLAMRGDLELSQIETLASDLITASDTASLIYLCQSLVIWPTPALVPLHLRIYASTNNLELRTAALKAMHNIGNTDCLPVAEQAYNKPELTTHAEALFLRCGTDGFDHLQSMLRSDSCDYRTRITIPSTMGKFDLPNISERLIEQLSYEEDGAISFKILRALGRTGIVATNHQNKQQQLAQLDKLVSDELARLARYSSALRVMRGQVVSVNSGIFDMLFQLVADRAQESLERLFRIFNLRYEDNQFEQLFLDLQSAGERERANAEELLSHTVPRLVAAPVLNAILILADMPDLTSPTAAEAASKACSDRKNKHLQSMMRKELSTFKTLLNDQSAMVSALTAYLVGCAKFIELADEVSKQAHLCSEASRECFHSAMQMLSLQVEEPTPAEVS